jgi:hypothetical protein
MSLHIIILLLFTKEYIYFTEYSHYAEHYLSIQHFHTNFPLRNSVLKITIMKLLLMRSIKQFRKKGMS